MLIHFVHDQLVIGHMRSSPQIVPVFYDGAHSKGYEYPPDRILEKRIFQPIPNLTSGKEMEGYQNIIKKETDKR